MLDAHRTMGAPARESARGRPSSSASRGHGSLARAIALVVILAIVVTLAGGSRVIDPGNAIALEARASALQQRWTRMMTDGVPASDLAALRSEWNASQHPQLFGVPLNFLRRDMAAVIDRWDAESDQIWDRDLAAARAAALASESALHQAIGSEPLAQRNARLGALEIASTPAKLHELKAGWDLQALLVPIDRDVAAAVGALTAVSQTAKGLGILTEPAPALLGRAKKYLSLSDAERLSQAAVLLLDLYLGERDLKGRVAAATPAKAALKRAAAEISTAILYGVNVTDSQARMNKDSRAYSASTTPAQFASIRKDLDQLVADLKHKVNVILSEVHVIPGVAFISQTHALSCEEASVSMALTHQGIHLSQDQILAEIGADRRPMYIDSAGRVRWGDPYISFVGDVDGSESNYTGSQANYPPLVRVATAHGARIIAYGYMTAQTIYARLAAGHPVVAWATWDWAWHPRHDYLSFGGRWIPWLGPKYATHVYAVVGVSPQSVLVNDPIRGQYWVAKATFEAAYSDFMEAIVFA